MELCINRFIIRSDNLPIILIKSWPLEAALFDREQLAGPVPLQQGPGLSPDNHQRRPPEGPLGLQQDRQDLLHDRVHHDR